MLATLIFYITGAATFFTLGHVMGRIYQVRQMQRHEQDQRIKKYTVDVD